MNTLQMERYNQLFESALLPKKKKGCDNNFVDGNFMYGVKFLCHDIPCRIHLKFSQKLIWCKCIALVLQGMYDLTPAIKHINLCALFELTL